MAQVCRRLDGIPLALELAARPGARAARAEQLLARLDDRFRLLTGGSRTALPRHQTLRAAVDWSYDLLAAPERALFARLSVFAGGWTLEAAEAVARRSDGIAAEDVLDLLTRLVDQSLVAWWRRRSRTAPPATACWRRCASTPASSWRPAGPRTPSGSATPPTSSPLSEAVRRGGGRARGECLAWLRAARRASTTTCARALAWWLDTGQAEPALRLAAALASSGRARGSTARGAAGWRPRLAAGGEAPPALRARALNRRRLLAQWQGDYARARALHEASLAHWHALGDAARAAEAQQSLAWTCGWTGDAARAVALMEASLAFFRDHGLPAGVSRSLRDLGLVARSRGQYARAAALFAESVDQARAAGRAGWVARGLSHLGRVASLQGEPRLAAARLAEALTRSRRPRTAPGGDPRPRRLPGVGGRRGRGHGHSRPGRRACSAPPRGCGWPSGAPRYAPERPAYERDVAAARARSTSRRSLRPGPRGGR